MAFFKSLQIHNSNILRLAHGRNPASKALLVILTDYIPQPGQWSIINTEGINGGCSVIGYYELSRTLCGRGAPALPL